VWVLGIYLAGRGPTGCSDVSEEINEPHDRGPVTLDGGALGVGERDLDEHPLQTVLGAAARFAARPDLLTGVQASA
jgi:hypothetical protein